MKSKLRLLALFLSAAMLLTLVACNRPGDNPAEEPDEYSNYFKWVSTSYDTCLNPHDSNAAGNVELIQRIGAGLYHFIVSEDGAHSVVTPCLAVGEPESEDGIHWKIHINPQAKWSNGEPINADTFLYSWKMGLDPKLLYNAMSSLAEMYIIVKNGLKYYMQLPGDDIVNWEDVGFGKEDDYTLTVTTDGRYTVTDVMRHFSQSCTFPVYEKSYEAGMNAERTKTTYGTVLDGYLCSGMFSITEWTKGSKCIMVKNANYVCADEVKLEGIVRRVVPGENTRLQLFESGENDFVTLSTNGMQKYGEDARAMSYDLSTIRMLEVNLNHPDHPWLKDVDFRKALYYALDRTSIAKLALATPATFFVSGTAVIYNDGTMYRDLPEATDWLPANNGYNPELAKQLFDSVMQKYGLSTMHLTICYSENIEALRPTSEFIQTQLPEIFGKDRISVELKAMNHDTLLAMMKATVDAPCTDYDLCWSGRYPLSETFQPFRKFNHYQSSYVGRYADYTNTFLDQSYPLFTTEEYRFDEQKTKDLTVAVEKSIILDNVTAIPVFQEKGTDIFSDRVKLPVTKFINTLGWAWEYGELVTK